MAHRSYLSRIAARAQPRLSGRESLVEPVTTPWQRADSPAAPGPGSDATPLARRELSASLPPSAARTSSRALAPEPESARETAFGAPLEVPRAAAHDASVPSLQRLAPAGPPLRAADHPGREPVSSRDLETPPAISAGGSSGRSAPIELGRSIVPVTREFASPEPALANTERLPRSRRAERPPIDLALETALSWAGSASSAARIVASSDEVARGSLSPSTPSRALATVALEPPLMAAEARGLEPAQRSLHIGSIDIEVVNVPEPPRPASPPPAAAAAPPAPLARGFTTRFGLRQT